MQTSPGTIEHLTHLHRQLGDVLAASAHGPCAETLCKAQGVVSDLDVWLEVLRDRRESSSLSTAFREYASSVLLASLGLYRPAFYALRHYLEVSLGSIWLSSNELNLRLWNSGKLDLHWSATIHDETGVFSHLFVRVFCEPLLDSAAQLTGVAKKVYRECSEFVHGNPPATARLPTNIDFSRELLQDWLTHVDTVNMLVQSALTIRYLTSLSAYGVRRLEGTIRDNLGHHQAIRDYLDGEQETSRHD